MQVILLAGGGGTRLWPLSRSEFPKQFLHFGDHRSLLEKTISRFLASSTVKKIFVSTNIQYHALVAGQLGKFHCDSRFDILVEPARKNTAPAMALALKFLEETGQVSADTPIFISPSDHLIEPEHVFLRFIEKVPEWVKQDDIVLFGISPSRPETGYGYIQVGEKAKDVLFFAKRFIEKPDLVAATEYCASGDFYWNAGMFAFSVRTFWKELAECAPEISHLFSGDYASCLEHFHEAPEISFDYAVLEKSKRVVVCPLPVSWSDVGSWESVYDVLDKDHNQNVMMGNVMAIETKNSLIFGGKKLISTIGLDDLLVIETEDAILISKKGESQRLKSLVQELVKRKKI